MVSSRASRGIIVAIMSSIVLILSFGQACSDSFGFKNKTNINRKSNGGGYGGMVPVDRQFYTSYDRRPRPPTSLSAIQSPSFQFNDSFYSFGMNPNCSNTSTPVGAAAAFIDQILMIRTTSQYELVMQASSACDPGRILNTNPLQRVDFNANVGVTLDAELSEGRVFIFYSKPPTRAADIVWPRAYCKNLEPKVDPRYPDTGIDVLIFSQNDQTYASVVQGSKYGDGFSAISYQPIRVANETFKTSVGSEIIYKGGMSFSLATESSDLFETSGRLSIELEQGRLDVPLVCFVPK